MAGLAGGGGGGGGFTGFHGIPSVGQVIYNTSVLKRVVISCGIYTAVDQVKQHDKN